MSDKNWNIIKWSLLTSIAVIFFPIVYYADNNTEQFENFLSENYWIVFLAAIFLIGALYVILLAASRPYTGGKVSRKAAVVIAVALLLVLVLSVFAAFDMN